jgi:hypothetical protein
MNRMNAWLLPLLGAVAVVSTASTATADAASPTGRYTYTSASVTVYDTKTKLTWQRMVPSMTYSWADAKTYCASPAVNTILGGAGRLPTIKELVTLIDFSQSAAPAIDVTAFPGTPSSYFWSSSPQAGSSNTALMVNFDFGSTSGLAAPLAATHNVRCVR